MRLTKRRAIFCPLLMTPSNTLWPCVSPSLAVLIRMMFAMIEITLLRAPGLPKSARTFAIEAARSLLTWSALLGFSSSGFRDSVVTDPSPLEANRGEAATDSEAPPSFASSSLLVLIRYAAVIANSLLEAEALPPPPPSASRPCMMVAVTDMSPPKLP
eukprot:CAMPEP_0114116386 /NCGR_PEP_ID=MMETSP0043_2-20121206/4470_1 /TAXON_ID=464988 /ORGANISM="Hemiselmis andersenii, Strain CCMP644" /LENGTH=157 /DNA_ID=CAMNT_0001208703 /DNA_START=33 /DNA_END=502 /DNA_ORIENTATION=+